MSRLPRPLRITLWLALCAYVAYLVGGNVFLNTASGQQAINRVPERFQLAWSRAITPWPGYILAWDVVASGHARRVRWQARAEYAGGRIALLPLLWRELRLPDIGAHEVTFAADRVEDDLLPREPSPRVWTVVLPRIHSDTLLEVRWNDLRLLGGGEAEFGMSKQLRSGPLQIFPSTLRMPDARFSRGEDVLLTDARIDASFAMDRHPPLEFPGRSKIEPLHARLQLEGVVPALDLTLDTGEKLDVGLQPGAGRITIDLALENAELQRGGTVTLELPVSLAADGAARRDNTFSLQAHVGDDVVLLAQLPQQPDGRARLDAELRIAQRTLPLQGWDPLLANTSGRVSLLWRFDSLQWLSELLVKNDWLAFDGAGELDAELQVEAGRLAPGSRFELPDVHIVTRVLHDRITGRGKATGRIEAGVAADAEPRASVKLLLNRFSIAPETTPEQTYVEGAQLALDLESTGDLARFRDTLSARLRFSDARVPDLTHYNHYLPQHSLRFRGGSGSLRGDLSLDAHGRVARGEFGVRASGAQMHMARIDLSGDVAIDTRLVRADLEQGRFDLDGSRIDLDRVAFRDAAGNERRDWWARITLPRAHAAWERPLEVDGEADIVMKDVGFLLALFSQKKKFPRWVARVIDAGEAQVGGQAQLRGKSLVLDRLQAENDRFRVRARLKLEDAKANGDLLLRWGVLSLGVELDESERDYRIIGATEWYESRPHLLDPLPPRSSGKNNR